MKLKLKVKHAVWTSVGILLIGLITGYLLISNNIQKIEAKNKVQIEKASKVTLKDEVLWKYLDPSTPQFKFSNKEPQKLMFSPLVEKAFNKVTEGDIITFPPVDVDKGILPFGITLEVKDIAKTDQSVTLTVLESGGSELLTDEDIKKLIEEAEQKEKEKKTDTK